MQGWGYSVPKQANTTWTGQQRTILSLTDVCTGLTCSFVMNLPTFPFFSPPPGSVHYTASPRRTVVSLGRVPSLCLSLSLARGPGAQFRGNFRALLPVSLITPTAKRLHYQTLGKGGGRRCVLWGRGGCGRVGRGREVGRGGGDG